MSSQNLDFHKDTENDIGRLNLGKKIRKPRKNKDINNNEKRRICKEKLRDGHYTPREFLQTTSHTIGNLSSTEELFSSDSDSSEEENIEDEVTRNICVVYALEPALKLGFSCHVGMLIVVQSAAKV